MPAHLREVDTTNFIHVWLTKDDPSPGYTAFQHLPLAELEGRRESIRAPLAEAIFVHHNDPEELQANLAALGYAGLAETLDKRPRNANTRKSNFGEILAAEYLSQSEGYQIPVYRLRYNPNPESAMKGDDVLGFKFGDAQGQGREIVVAEAKVRGRFASSVVTEACAQLADGHRPRPKSILFVVSILRNEGRVAQAEQVLAFLNKFAPNQPATRALVFLITGNRPTDPFGCVQERHEVIENLTAANLWLPELDEFVDDVFDFEVQRHGS
jgi:hypothetical protein